MRGVLMMAAALISLQAAAQAPDTTAVPDSLVARDTLVVPDSLADSHGQAVGDSLAPDDSLKEITTVPAGPPLDVDDYREGALTDTLPLAGTYVAGAVEWLDALPGSFRYGMGNLGWPDQVSFRGLPPRHTGLTLDGLPIHDPVTGRALFELLPFDLLNTPRLFTGRHSAGPGSAFYTRRFNVETPRTELRYRVGGPGLQSISAAHIQQRRIRLFGAERRLRVLFRFASGTWGGEYPNSFSDITQLDGRIGLYSENWAVRLTNFLTRRHGGAHGGVIVPPGRDLDEVYDTFDADVNNPNATFRTKRSDIRLAVDRILLQGVRPFSAQISWVSHVRRYRNVETSEALVHEYTVAAAQQIPGLPSDQYLAVRMLGRLDDVRSASVFTDTTDLGQSHFEALVESKIQTGATRFSGHVGFAASDGHTLPRISLAGDFRLAGLDVSAQLDWSGRAPSRLEQAGSGHIGPGRDPLAPEQTQSTTLSIKRVFGRTSVGVEVFATSIHDPLDIRQVAADSFDVAQSSFGLSRFGLTGLIGWRDREDRGFYGIAQSTVQGTDPDAVGDTFLDAIDESLPSMHGRARLGARYVLFQGDLDVDLYVVGRYWSSFRSRVYDPVTGVLALPSAEIPDLGGSGTLDVRLEAVIRTATAFVGMENVLASVSYPGAMLVPYYPLAAQAFRFGVYWPIDN